MSARLEIRVQHLLLGEQARAGAVVDILPVAGEERATAYRGVVVPASSRDSKGVTVAPGRYLVRASLPSGAVLSTMVTAVEDTTTEVVFATERPPHEWLGWHDLVSRRRAHSRESSDSTLTPHLRVGSAPRGRDAWSRASVALADRPGGARRAFLERLAAGVPAMTPSIIDDFTAAFVLQDDLPDREARVAVIERGARVDVMALPTPWYRRDGEAAVVDVAVPRAEEGAPTTAVQDPDLGPLLGALASGRLPLAWALSEGEAGAVERFMEALGGKRQNPYAAAAGAYLLLQFDCRADAPWHPWVKNLSEWFPWLPDGAALEGALRLRRATTDADVAAARAAFEDAIARGVPVFAPVLRLLLDGVTTLVDDPDADAGTLPEVLPHLRGVARAMVMDQALTTLTFGVRS